MLENTQANDASTTSDFLGGGILGFDLSGRNLLMSNCQGNGTSYFDPVNGGGAGGIDIHGSLNVYLKNCQFNDTFGESGFVVNYLTSIINGVYENCQFNNTRGGDNAFIVQAVHSSGVGGNGSKYINCQFNGTSVSPNNPGGYFGAWVTGLGLLADTNVIIENCQACNIATTNPGWSAYGFITPTFPLSQLPIGVNSNITFKNCVASDIIGGASSAGFFLAALNTDKWCSSRSQKYYARELHCRKNLQH